MFKTDTLAMATDNKRCLTVADIAGLPVGHVPRGLAGVFRALLQVVLQRSNKNIAYEFSSTVEPLI